jgi:Mg2+/citrate symporter
MYKLVAVMLAVLCALVVTLDGAEAGLFKVCVQPRAPLYSVNSPFPNTL